MRNLLFSVLADHKTATRLLFSRWLNLSILVVIVFNLIQPVPVLAQPGAADPSPTPLPASDSAVNPKVDVTPTSQPAQGPSASPTTAPRSQLLVQLTAAPKFITGSGTVTVKWSIAGKLPQSGGLTLQISLADGYTPQTGLTYDTTGHLLSLPVSTSSGQFTLSVQNPTDDVSFPASLLDSDGKSLADGQLFLPVHEKFSVKKAGSNFSARNGRIRVSYGAGVMAEDATLEIGAPAGDAMPVRALSNQPFEIDAQGAQSKQDLHQFAGDIAIDVDYSNIDLGGRDANNLFLYWYDPVAKDWAALPSHVDPASKTLHATTTHFSVFDISLNDWQATHLPSVDAFQVSQFTGAATYSLPIEVPQGPGGLQPSLSLSYNSQVIDQSSMQTQASWVGMGWSLDAGSIELNNHGTTDDVSIADDTWSLNVAGISTSIVRDASDPNAFHSTNETFIKVGTFVNSAGDHIWRVWDKQGNMYTFGHSVMSAYDDCSGVLHVSPAQWLLTGVQNVYGQKLTYSYYDETKPIYTTRVNGNGACEKMNTVDSPTAITTASYLDTITYANGHYRIVFERAERSDYPSTWIIDAAYHSFQRSRLKDISIEQDASGDGSFSSVNVIRAYKFNYASNIPSTWATSADGTTHAPVWPGVLRSAGGYMLTLLLVQ